MADLCLVDARNHYAVPWFRVYAPLLAFFSPTLAWSGKTILTRINTVAISLVTFLGEICDEPNDVG
jgi:hypothetical protein